MNSWNASELDPRFSGHALRRLRLSPRPGGWNFRIPVTLRIASPSDPARLKHSWTEGADWIHVKTETCDAWVRPYEAVLEGTIHDDGGELRVARWRVDQSAILDAATSCDWSWVTDRYAESPGSVHRGMDEWAEQWMSALEGMPSTAIDCSAGGQAWQEPIAYPPRQLGPKLVIQSVNGTGNCPDVTVKNEGNQDFRGLLTTADATNEWAAFFSISIGHTGVFTHNTSNFEHSLGCIPGPANPPVDPKGYTISVDGSVQHEFVP